MKYITALLSSWTKTTTPSASAVSVQFGITVLLALICTLLLSTISADFNHVSYRFDNGPWHTTSLPFFVDTEGKILNVEFSINVPALHGGMYLVKPDDCIESVHINGIKIADDSLLFCDYGEGRDVEWGPYLHTGTNNISLTLRDDGGKGGLSVKNSAKDPLKVVLALIVIATVTQFLLFVFRHLRTSRRRYIVSLILLTGLALRTLYVSATPWETRGHDTGAHIDYIEYITAHAAIPEAEDGWEYHQPPLYYALMAVPMSVMTMTGNTTESSLPFIQFLSLIGSVITLWIGCAIGLVLFPDKRDNPLLFLFCGILATFPSLVFMASRITNDALFVPLGMAVTYFLVRWWKSDSWRDWYAACILCGLALITKNTALVLVAAAGLSLFLRPSIRWKQRCIHALGAALIALLIAGWYPVLRIVIEERTSRTLSLGNMEMSDALRVENSWQTMTTFNPIQVLQHPFNNPWAQDTRREFYLEYLFRSAFFGEFQFMETLGALAPILLFHALLLLPFIIVGVYFSSFHTKQLHWPIIILFVLFLAASIAYRALFPFSPNQDFRFILPILPSVAFLLCKGIGGVPKALSYAGLWTTWLMIGLSTWFIVIVSAM